MKAQGYDLRKNAYNNRWQPYIAYWGIFWTSFFILVNGFTVFFAFTSSGFLTSYINIPIFAGLYVGYKIWKRTRTWKPLEMDFVTGIPTFEETENPLEKPKNVIERIGNFLF